MTAHEQLCKEFFRASHKALSLQAGLAHENTLYAHREVEAGHHKNLEENRKCED